MFHFLRSFIEPKKVEEERKNKQSTKRVKNKKIISELANVFDINKEMKKKGKLTKANKKKVIDLENLDDYESDLSNIKILEDNT